MIKQLVIALVWTINNMSFAQTDWQAPVTIATTAGTSSTRFYLPTMAAGPDGALAAVWTGQSGAANTTGNYPIPSERFSQVYFTASTNSGTSWTTPKVISDPRVLSSQVKVISGLPGEFYCTWTSGDPLSGYRLHSASTSDYGETFTTSTWLQHDTDSTLGFIEPAVAISGANRVLIHNAITQDTPFRSNRAHASIQPIGSSEWALAATADVPTQQFSYSSNDGSIAVSTADVIVPTVVSYSNQTDPNDDGQRIRLLISRNSGLTWETTDVQTTPVPTMALQSKIAAANDTWLLLWRFQFGRIFFHKSTDSGETWTSTSQLHQGFSDIGSVVSDGSGRWVTALSEGNYAPVKYVWSEDDGTSWSTAASIPGTVTTRPGETIVYHGNGRWSFAFTDFSGSSIKLSTLIWGASAIDEWQLY